MTEAFNRQLVGVNAEIWVHTCWGNPNQQRVYWEVPSYERALPHLLQLDCDVITFECASSEGRDLPLFGKYKTDKKIGIGVVNHCNTVVEPPEYVAMLIRKALEYHPARTPGDHHRLRLRPRRPEPAHRVLQMRLDGRGHQHRPPRARVAGGARARGRCALYFASGMA